jgi:hypothetical protein
MAVLSPLLSRAERESDILWPALREVKLCRLGADEFDGLCDIISHRHACSKPIDVVAIDPASLEKFPKKVEWMKQHVTVQWGRRSRVVVHSTPLITL